ncbi:MAG: hypothetical protein ACR2QK_17045 [Acidimicrobiales bacterium]
MIGSTVLDVVIGLILLYLMSSIAVSAFNEVVEGLLKRRSKYLRATLERMTGTDLAQELYETSWIQSLSDYSHALRTQALRDVQVGGRQPFGEKKPSYIPVDVFVEALREVLDGLVRRTEDALQKLEDGGSYDDFIAALPPRIAELLPKEITTAAALRAEIDRIIPIVRQEILDLFPRGVLDDLEGEALKLREWFEFTMDRMSGWYGRQTKWLLLAWGIVFALILNIGTFNIARSLWSDDVTRAAVVAAAEGATQGGEPTDCQPSDDDPYSCVDDALDKIRDAEGLGIPMGWPAMPWNWGDPALDVDGNEIDGVTIGDDERIPQSAGAWFYRLLGIVVTGAAVALGAPFWFDLLNKFVNFRAAGPKPQRTATEVVVST